MVFTNTSKLKRKAAVILLTSIHCYPTQYLQKTEESSLANQRSTLVIFILKTIETPRICSLFLN